MATDADPEADTRDPAASLLRWLDVDDRDPGCGGVADLMHVFVEELLRGSDPEQNHPGITAHLRACGPCREDVDGLLALLGGPAAQVSPPARVLTERRHAPRPA